MRGGHIHQVHSISLLVAAAQVVIDDDIAKLGLFGSFPPLKILTAPGAAVHPWRWSAGILFLFCKAFPALSLVVP
jgi:hypothetical protein